MWGGVSQLLLTKSNQELLFRDGSLLNFEKKIPQVIKDAMQFVRNIGERYLWVDSLCIVQDDESIKHHLISNMGSIYNSAVATIVAASGEDATHGLPGVRENTRVLENSMEIPGTGLHITFDASSTPLWIIQLTIHVAGLFRSDYYPDAVSISRKRKYFLSVRSMSTLKID